MCRFKEIEFLLKENIFIADYFRFIFIVGGSQAGRQGSRRRVWLKLIEISNIGRVSVQLNYPKEEKYNKNNKKEKEINFFRSTLTVNLRN